MTPSGRFIPIAWIAHLRLAARFAIANLISVAAIACCLCGIPKSGMTAAVHFREFGLPSQTLLDPIPSPVPGVTFIDTTYLVIDPRFVDNYGVVSTITDATDNKLGFAFPSSESVDHVFLDIITINGVQDVVVSYTDVHGGIHSGLQHIGSTDPAANRIPIDATVAGGGQAIAELLVSGPADEFGVDCVTFAHGETTPACGFAPPPLCPPGALNTGTDIDVNCIPQNSFTFIGVAEPVPEPTTLILLLSNLLGMCAWVLWTKVGTVWNSPRMAG